MARTDIEVPNLDDSFSQVVLDGKQYLIRFTWNRYVSRWSFGIFNMQSEPIIQGIRIVPRFPLNMQTVNPDMPSGIFGAFTNIDVIGREDFLNGKATFSYVSENGKKI